MTAKEVPTSIKKNLIVWDKVTRTDPTFTKHNKYAAGGSTSINTTYLFKRATEIFVPICIGWGYKIVSDHIQDGATKHYGTEQNIKTMTESIHTLRINFWYVLEGQRGEFEQYGHTDFVTLSKQSVVHTESEPQKKSLSDAIKKSLSMLGFSSDIFLGLYDDDQYVKSVKLDLEAEGAEIKIDRQAEKALEFRDWVDEQVTLLHEATNRNAVSLYYKKAVRVLAERLSHQRISQTQHDGGARLILEESDKAATKFDDQEKENV